MLEILLGSPKEAKLIYSIFRTMCRGNETELQIVNQQSIKISPEIWDVTIEKLVIPGLIQFIINHKEHQIMGRIIKDFYFFLEEEEQQQIIHIAQSIIEGERTDIPRVDPFFPRDVILRDALEGFLKPDLYFSFTSFQQFRLHKYIARIQEYVEVAIEEYKLEQEYQSFIQSLRDYLITRNAVIDKLSIVHDHKNFFVYKAKQVMPENELVTYIDKTFVHQHPMYIDSKLLGPIVSIAPKQIFLYTNDPFDGMVQTIQNIFQERVSLQKRNEFQTELH